MNANTKTLKKAIETLIDKSDNNKEVRKVIIYSLVVVWLKYKENKEYTAFCDFVKSNSSNLITFGADVTDFADSAENAVSCAESAKLDKAAVAFATLNATAAVAGFAFENFFTSRVRDAAIEAANTASPTATTRNTASADAVRNTASADAVFNKAQNTASADAVLYCLIAAYLYLM